MSTTHIPKIAKIVAGGQTGADRGGLDAAIHCQIPHGGWCPKGRKAEDGIIPAKYDLQEMTSADYLVRTEANVVDSDCTIIFTLSALEGGSKKTAQFAKKHNKPCLHVDITNKGCTEVVQLIVKWLQETCPSDCTLNVAGSRGSKAPTLHNSVMETMVGVISKVNGTVYYPLCDGCKTSKTEGDENFDSTPQDVTLPNDTITHKTKPHPEPIILSPKTMNEAIELVIKSLSPKNRREIKQATDRDEFVIDQHFGMVLWVRNALIHLNPNALDLYTDFQKKYDDKNWSGYPPIEPDKISAVIIGLVWDEIHKGL